MSITDQILEALAVPMTVPRVMKRCAVSRAVAVEAIDQLRAAGKVRCARSSRGRHEWQALAPHEVATKLAFRALMSELRGAHEAFRLLDDLTDVGAELSILMRLPDDVRERIAALSDAYDKTLEC